MRRWACSAADVPGVRKLTGIVSKSRPPLSSSTQLREKIGVMFGTRKPRPAAAR